MIVVVDFNILFSALLKFPNKYAETIFLSENQFYTPRFAINEFFKHKEKIFSLSDLEDDEIIDLLYLLFRNIHIEDEKHISIESLQTAYQLCKNIDEKDTIYIALTIDLNAKLWTGDKQLKTGLRKKGFDNFF